MTFAFWARWDALNSYSRILDTSNGPENNLIAIFNEATSNVLGFEIQEFVAGATKKRRIRVLNGIEVGTWTHWVCTSDNYGYM